MSEENKLPTLKELHHDVEVAFKNDALNALLANNPPKEWIKSHDFVSIKVNGKNEKLQYITVEKVKFLLTKIFQEWSSEIIDYKPLFNSVAVHVRLKVKNPITGEWITHDGVGAVDVQTKSGASPADLSQINSSAVMKALPAAASYALKNAAEKLGAIFGGNLQKTDIVAFSPAYDEELKKNINAKLKERYATGAENK